MKSGKAIDIASGAIIDWTEEHEKQYGKIMSHEKAEDMTTEQWLTALENSNKRATVWRLKYHKARKDI